LHHLRVTLNGRELDGEAAADINEAPHLYGAAHQSHQFLCDAQSETEALLCVGILQSVERRIDALDLFLGHVRARVGYGHRQGVVPILQLHAYLYAFSELDGIRQQVAAYLDDTLAVADHHGVVTLEVIVKVELLGICQRRKLGC